MGPIQASGDWAALSCFLCMPSGFILLQHGPDRGCPAGMPSPVINIWSMRCQELSDIIPLMPKQAQKFGIDTPLNTPLEGHSLCDLGPTMPDTARIDHLSSFHLVQAVR